MARPGHRCPQCSPGSIPIKGIELNGRSRGDLPHAPLNQFTRYYEIIGTRNAGWRFRQPLRRGLPPTMILFRISRHPDSRARQEGRSGASGRTSRAQSALRRIGQRLAVLNSATGGSAGKSGLGCGAVTQNGCGKEGCLRASVKRRPHSHGARVSGALCRLHPLGGVLRRLLLRILARVVKTFAWIVKAIDCFSDGLLVLRAFLLDKVRD